MRYAAQVTMSGVAVEVEGPEVEACFGGPVAGGPLEDFEFPTDGSSVREAVVARVIRYCEENALPAPTPAQVVVLGA
jgi:hypothetical protein